MFKKITLWLHIFLQVPYLHYFLSLKTPLCLSPSPSDQLVGSGQGIQLRSMHEIQRGGPENSIMMYMHACVLSHFSCVWLFVTLACQSVGFASCPGKNTGVGCHFLLQGIFLAQEWNLCLLCLLNWQRVCFLFFTTELPGKPQYLNADAYSCVCVCVCVLLRSKVGWWIKYEAWNILF